MNARTIRLQALVRSQFTFRVRHNTSTGRSCVSEPTDETVEVEPKGPIYGSVKLDLSWANPSDPTSFAPVRWMTLEELREIFPPPSPSSP